MSNIEPKILEDYLKKSGLRYKNGASSYIFTCPICNKKDKLYIRKKDGRFVCFFCKDTQNFQGKPEFALSKLLDIPIYEVRARLYLGQIQYNPVIDIKFTSAPFNSIVNDSYISVAAVAKELPEILHPPSHFTINLKLPNKAFNYLKNRGIGPEIIQKYNIKYAPAEQRVIFPVLVEGRLLGWQGRYINKIEGNTIPKIITSKGLSGGQYFMFQDNIKNKDYAVLTEGPVDAIKADLCGGNIAAMGKGVSMGQIQTLLSYKLKRLYFGLDRDAATDTARIIKEIMNHSVESIEFYLIQPPAHRGDLGDCTPEEVLEQFKKAEKIVLPHIFIYFNRKNNG
jgi:hypothetical protein